MAGLIQSRRIGQLVQQVRKKQQLAVGHGRMAVHPGHEQVFRDLEVQGDLAALAVAIKRIEDRLIEIQRLLSDTQAAAINAEVASSRE